MNGAIEALREPLGEIADLGRGPGAARLGRADADAAGGAPMPRRADRHPDLAPPPQPRLRRARPPARRRGRARSRAAVRLLRGEPGARHPPRLGEGPPGADRAARRDRPRDVDRRARLGGGPRGRRLRGLPPPPRARRRAKRRYVECFEFDHPYDAAARRLRARDDAPPTCAPSSSASATASSRCSQRVVERGDELDPAPLFGRLPDADAGRARPRAPAALPLEPDAWRLDSTVHPFAVGIAIADLRITTRYDPEYLGTALWAVIHEVGHALYENGLDPALERTPLCRPVSLGFARVPEPALGELGRPRAAVHDPAAAAAGRALRRAVRRPRARRLYRAANAVGPSLIRVEADEVTYNLHIVLRFELEQQIFDGTLALTDLPEAWNARMAAYFGLDVPTTPTACSRTCTGRRAPSATSPRTRWAT